MVVVLAAAFVSDTSSFLDLPRPFAGALAAPLVLGAAFVLAAALVAAAVAFFAGGAGLVTLALVLAFGFAGAAFAAAALFGAIFRVVDRWFVVI